MADSGTNPKETIVELIVQYEASTKLIRWIRREDLFMIIKKKFDIRNDTPIILQRNHAKYKMFIDLEDDELSTLRDGTVLKVIIKPSTLVMDAVPIPESTTLENAATTKSFRSDLEPLTSQDFSDPPPQVPSTSATASTSAEQTDQTEQSNKSVWPDTFTIPSQKFSMKLETELNKLKAGESLSWDAKREFIRHITEKIFNITCYPSRHQILMVAQAVVTQYPVLRDKVGSGIDSWIQGVKEGMRNARRTMKTPEVVARKRKTAAGEKVETVKIPNKGEMVWAPPVPEGEDELSHDRHCKAMKFLLSSNETNAKAKISNLMEATFALRRQYMLHEKAQVAEIKERYPALFKPCYLKEEFYRISHVDLEKQFGSGLLKQTEPLLSLARKQVGTRNQKLLQNEKQRQIAELLQPLPGEASDLQKQATALLLLPVLLQDKGVFIKAYTKFKDAILMSVHEPEPFVAVDREQMSSNTYYIVGEGGVIIDSLGSIHEAVAVLFAIYYVCLLKYPKKTYNTYKFLQHEVMGMGNDGSSVPSKLANFVKQLAVSHAVF